MIFIHLPPLPTFYFFINIIICCWCIFSSLKFQWTILEGILCKFATLSLSQRRVHADYFITFAPCYGDFSFQADMMKMMMMVVLLLVFFDYLYYAIFLNYIANFIIKLFCSFRDGGTDYCYFAHGVGVLFLPAPFILGGVVLIL